MQRNEGRPLPQEGAHLMPNAEDPDDQLADHLVVAFPCSLCDRPAATVDLAPDGAVVVEALIGRITQWIGPMGVPRLGMILASRDVRALYALNAEWASFYCPTCDRAYCSAHWHFDVRYDDDFPGWYDCTYGTCPMGHRRLVDD
jgi:hypothetical protein